MLMIRSISVVLSCLLLMASTVSRGVAQWMLTDGPQSKSVTCFMSGTDRLFAGTLDGGVYVSTDGGLSWLESNQGLTDYTVTSISFFDDLLFAATHGNGQKGGGVFVSSDAGKTWTPRDSGLQAMNAMNAFTVQGSSIFVAGYQSELYRLHLGDMVWHRADSGLSSVTIFALASLAGGSILAGCYGSGILRLPNDSSSWLSASTGLTSKTVWSFFVDSNEVFAGTDHGVFRSMDDGRSWSAANAGYPFTAVNCLEGVGNLLFAGTTGKGILVSQDNGASWSPANAGLLDTSVYAVKAMGPYLYVGTRQQGIWRRPLSDFGLSSERQPVLSNRSLTSFPNPFTKSTTICFPAQVHSEVSVRIVNLLGEHVTELFSGTLDPGDHSLTWDAAGAAPGRYMCVVRSDGHVQQLPILLVR